MYVYVYACVGVCVHTSHDVQYVLFVGKVFMGFLLI